MAETCYDYLEMVLYKLTWGKKKKELALAVVLCAHIDPGSAQCMLPTGVGCSRAQCALLLWVFSCPGIRWYFGTVHLRTAQLKLKEGPRCAAEGHLCAGLPAPMPREDWLCTRGFYFFRSEFIMLIIFVVKLKYRKQTLPCGCLWAYGE